MDGTAGGAAFGNRGFPVISKANTAFLRLISRRARAARREPSAAAWFSVAAASTLSASWTALVRVVTTSREALSSDSLVAARRKGFFEFVDARTAIVVNPVEGARPQVMLPLGG